VVVWADGRTSAAGSISARGGAQSGDGGFVEVSGKQWLGFNARVDTRAPKGHVGTLLLDPQDIDIDTNTTTVTYAGSTVFWEDIEANLANNDVAIATNVALPGSGNINTHSEYAFNTTSNLSLLAIGDININAGISNSVGGGFNLVAGWDGVSTTNPTLAARAMGRVNINPSTTNGIYQSAYVASPTGTIRVKAAGGISNSDRNSQFISQFNSDVLNLELGGDGSVDPVNTIDFDANKLRLTMLPGATNASLYSGREYVYRFGVPVPKPLEVQGVNLSGAYQNVGITHFGDINVSGAITDQVAGSSTFASLYLSADAYPWSLQPTPPRSMVSVNPTGSINIGANLEIKAGSIAFDGQTSVAGQLKMTAASDSIGPLGRVVMGGATRDATALHLTDSDLAHITTPWLWLIGGEVNVNSAVTLQTGLKQLWLSADGGATTITSGTLPFLSGRIRINAPLTLSDPGSMLWMASSGLDIAGNVDVGTGSIQIQGPFGYYPNHQNVPLVYPDITLGLPEGQNKQVTPGLELRNSELRHLHTTGPLIIGAINAGYVGNMDSQPIRFAGPIDLTTVTSHLHLNGTSVSQAPGATITVPDLSVFSVLGVSLGEANQVSRFSDRSLYSVASFGVPASGTTDILFRSDA